MTDIELVIKIPKETYEAVCNENMLPYNIVNAIKNSTPLPKGHGKLKDVDLLATILTEQYPKNYAGGLELGGMSCEFSLRYLLKLINSESDMSTIVEAESSEVEE